MLNAPDYGPDAFGPVGDCSSDEYAGEEVPDELIISCFNFSVVLEPAIVVRHCCRFDRFGLTISHRFLRWSAPPRANGPLLWKIAPLAQAAERWASIDALSITASDQVPLCSVNALKIPCQMSWRLKRLQTVGCRPGKRLFQRRGPTETASAILYRPWQSPMTLNNGP